MGSPVVETLPESADLSRLFLDVTERIVSEIDALETKTMPKVGYLPEEASVVISGGDWSYKIKALELRKAC
jgi:hypothetical protein